MSVKNIFKGLLLSVAAFGVNGGSTSAAEGDIDREGRVVYITGDHWQDDCQVYVDGDEIVIELSVYDSDGELDDTDDKDYDIEDIDLIVFQGFAGDDDFWNNTPVPCVAYGDDGNDTLLGGWSDDDLHGGKGDDFIAGRSGDDDLYGDSGSDYLYGGTEDDYLKAGTGEYEWVIAGQSGEDTFANPGMLNWWSRYLVPIQRDAYYYDFNPQFDVEVLFWAAGTSLPIISIPNISTPISSPRF